MLGSLQKLTERESHPNPFDTSQNQLGSSTQTLGDEVGGIEGIVEGVTGI